MVSNEYRAILKSILKFRSDRAWDSLETLKDLAMAAAIESAEVMQECLFRNETEIKARKQQISEEIADVLWYLMVFADRMGIDPAEAIADKMQKNAAKYPIKLCKGKNTKYTELQEQQQ